MLTTNYNEGQGLDSSTKTGRQRDSRVDAISDKVASASEGVQKNLRDAAYRAGETVSAAMDNTRHIVSNATSGTANAIRSNPIQASLAALGIGVLAGLFLRRK